MSHVTYDLLNYGNNTIHLILDHLVDHGGVYATAIVYGPNDYDIAEIFVNKGFEPMFEKEVVMYNYFSDHNECVNTIRNIFEELSELYPEAAIMSEYKIYDFTGELMKHITYLFQAKEENKWKQFIYRVTPFEAH